MTNTHTPAPWLFNDNDGISVTDKDLNTIANLYLEENDYREQYDLPNAEANARLISAAPELLAALEKAERWIVYAARELEADPQAGRDARAAIAKARG